MVLLGCNTGDLTAPKEGVPIRYYTNTIDLNVSFCNPDGNLDVVYGTIGFDTTLYFSPGSKVCLSAEKRNKNTYQSVIVRIWRDSAILFSHKEDDGASISGYLE